MHQGSYRGSSLIEYALPLTVFCFTAIFVIMTTDLPAEIGLFFQDTVNGNAQGEGVHVKPYGTVANRGNGSTGNQGNTDQGNPDLPPAVSGFSNVQITLGSGKKITIQNYPADLAQNIETAGVRGTTETLLGNLSALIQQLEENGEIDATQTNLLKDLANKGHEIAAIQKILEDEAYQIPVSSSDYWAEIDTIMVQYNGETRSLGSLAGEVGTMHGPDGVTGDCDDNGNCIYHTDPLIQDWNRGPTMQEFVDLYHAAESAGALDDPVVQQVIAALAGEIAFMGATMEDFYWEVGMGYRTSDSVRETMISQSTNYDAVKICETGGSADTGIRCL